jgi:hypothetical protein
MSVSPSYIGECFSPVIDLAKITHRKQEFPFTGRAASLIVRVSDFLKKESGDEPRWKVQAIRLTNALCGDLA